MVDQEGYPVLKQGVHVVATGRDGATVQLTAVVDGISEQGELTLGCLDAVKANALVRGLTVTLEYFRDTVVFNLKSSIIETLPAQQPPATRSRPQIVLATPLELKKIQRRRFPRALVTLAASYVHVEVPGGFDPQTRKGERLMARWSNDLETSGQAAMTETLSGSGMRLRTEGRVARGDHIFIELSLPDEVVELVGEVVWIGSSAPREAPGVSVGIEFKSLSETARRAVLGFVGGKSR